MQKLKAIVLALVIGGIPLITFDGTVASAQAKPATQQATKKPQQTQREQQARARFLQNQARVRANTQARQQAEREALKKCDVLAGKEHVQCVMNAVWPTRKR